MGVAAHLGIDLAEYDDRIRTFIPDYEEMLDVAATAVPTSARTIVDLGTGTGALAARCLERARKAHIVGIDSDTGILAAAAERLQERGSFLCTDFVRSTMPACDVVVTSFALHHVKSKASKAALFRRIHSALHRGGTIISVDCYPAADADLAREQHEEWKQHLQNFYSKARAAALLRAWSREDSYMPLDVETGLMSHAGFKTEILWRKGSFAILVGKR
jgi:trans-aconitate methyltransferase